MLGPPWREGLFLYAVYTSGVRHGDQRHAGRRVPREGTRQGTRPCPDLVHVLGLVMASFWPRLDSVSPLPEIVLKMKTLPTAYIKCKQC